MPYRKIAIALSSSSLLGAGNASTATSGPIAPTSDDVFRGVSQASEDPALQGGVDIFHDGRAHDSGLHVGAWGRDISWLPDMPGDISSSLEFDGYLGFRSTAGDAFTDDVGALAYDYPGDFPGCFDNTDTTGLYAGATLRATETLSLGLNIPAPSPACSAIPASTAAASSTRRSTGPSDPAGRSTRTAAGSGSNTTTTSKTPTGNPASPGRSTAVSRSPPPTPTPMRIRRSTPTPVATRSPTVASS